MDSKLVAPERAHKRQKLAYEGVLDSEEPTTKEPSIVWDIPDLVGEILKRLPPASLLSARPVCTTWNNVVMSSEPPLAGIAKSAKFNLKPCCLVFQTWPRRTSARMFDPGLWSWVNVSVPTTGDPREFLDLTLIPTSGNHGLVAFVEASPNREFWPPGFWVGNPMTNRWKHIPGAPEVMKVVTKSWYGRVCSWYPDDVKYEFVVDEPSTAGAAAARYRIVAMCISVTPYRDGNSAFTLVYDSATQRWKFGAKPPQPFYCHTTAFRDGRVLCMGTDSSDVDYEPHMEGLVIWSYSLEHDRFDLLVKHVSLQELDTTSLRFGKVFMYTAIFVKGEPLPLMLSFEETADDESDQVTMPLLHLGFEQFPLRDHESVKTLRFDGGGGQSVRRVGAVRKLCKVQVEQPNKVELSWALKPAPQADGLYKLLHKMLELTAHPYAGVLTSCGLVGPSSRTGHHPPAGEADHLYVNVASNRVGLYEAGEDNLRDLPHPFQDEQGVHFEHNICAFYPRFDFQP